VNNLVILPLSFLGGTFYSIDRLPSPWHELSPANPLFYLVNAVRYGFVGGADVSVASPWPSPPCWLPARRRGARTSSPPAVG
jgi:ABC-type multidrug transport system permease subunit